MTRANPNHGNGVSVVANWFDGEDVLAKLRQTFASPSYVPPRLPQVALELLQLSHDRDVSLPQVAKLLEHDAMLCGEVLRAAQSTVYSRGNRLTSIQQALSILGLATLRDIVLQVATSSRVFRAKAYQKPMEELRIHSMVVAHACRIVCRYTSLDAEYAFMCGLLHDVGKAGALIVLAENTSKPPPLEDVWHAIEEVHAEASEVMARHWRLPSEVWMVVGAHHTVRVQGHPHPLAAAIALGDHVAKEAGYGCSGPTIARQLDIMPMRSVVETLRLTPKQLQLIGSEVEKVAATCV